MENKQIVATVIAAVALGFGVGRFSAPAQLEAAPVAVAISTDVPAAPAVQSLSTEYDRLVEEFEEVTARPISQMDESAHQFIKLANIEYELECAYWVNDGNQDFCSRFQAAKNAHSNLMRASRIRELTITQNR